MIKGFKEFITKGNVIDLAVAVVIGTAFAALVNAVVTSLVTPLVNAAPGGKVAGLGFSLRGGDLERATFVNLAAIINAAVVFLMTALVVYLVIVTPMNRFNERRRRGMVGEEEPKPADTILLEEIRDLLKARPGA